MQIGNHQIYQSPPLDDRLENHFAEVCTMKVYQSLDDVLAEIGEQLMPEQYIQSNIESMAAAPEVRQNIHAEFDDPA